MSGKRRKDSGHVQELDVTALIDIVIILISFFIFFNNAADSETNERLNLPKSEIALPNEVLPAEPFTIQVTETGSVILNLQEYAQEKLDFILKFESQLYKDRKVDLNKVTVLVRGDSRCDTGKVMDAVKKCQEHGFKVFKFIALTDKG